MPNPILERAKLASLNRKNVVFTAIGLVLVAGIVFLPELLSLGGESGGGGDTVVSARPGDGSSHFSAGENSGIEVPLFEPSSDQRGRFMPTSLDLSLLQRTRPTLRETKDFLGRSRALALTLSQDLGPQRLRSRFALLDYANSVSALLGQGQELLSDHDIFPLFAISIRRALGAMQEEGVPNERYRSWIESAMQSLEMVDALRCEFAGPRDGSRSVRGEEKEREARADSFELRKQIPGSPVWFPKVLPRETYLIFHGMVADRRIKEIHLYHNGLRIDTLKMNGPHLRKVPEGSKFRYRMHAGQGIFLFRFVTEQGDFFDRKFDFYGDPTVLPRAEEHSVMLAQHKQENVFKEL